MYIADNKLNLTSFNRLPCPSCKDGYLRILKETLTHKHPSYIKQMPTHPSEVFEYQDNDENWQRPTTYFDIEGTEHDKYISSFYLECDRESCSEIVATIGESRLDGYYTEDKDENGNPYFNESFYYFPQFFYPTIRLFDIPIETPVNIKLELSKSFALFWSNPSASANSLRKVLERTLDYFDIKSGNLHHKIEKIDETTHPELSQLKNFLMATKWIGNDGSHDEVELIHYDLILGFKFIEKSLIKLFEKEDPNLEYLAEQINQSKKAISKIQ